MLVSQYIYTACGKERNGAFSVFSKSKDITDEESAEIREVMIYKAPSGAGIPYEPDEQQIEEFYPKKFGYFILSSGRACLAQVCYVGRVYSDRDMRWGNYIIHAFVFEKTNNFAPYSFVEHASFKRLLTKKEWHDDPIPDELPRVEIPENGGMMAMNEITSFFNEDRKNKLILLIEAIINSTNENPVHFYDEHKNIIFWLKVLNICLPKSMQNTFSFCTYFTNTLVPGSASSRIQIRVNQPENSLFYYAQEAQKGRYAFDFIKNITPASLNPGKYAKNIVISLFSGIFEAVKLVDNINKIMSAYNVNINEASELFNINFNIDKEDYTKINNAQEIYNTILIADRVSFETQSIAGKLWPKMTTINFNPHQRLKVLDFIYKNISRKEVKIEIIKTVIDNAEQLELRTDKPEAFRDDLNTKANFIFANYLDYLKETGLNNYLTNNQNSFVKLFPTFDFLANLPEVKNAFQAQKYTSSEELIAVIKIMVLAFKRKSLSDLDLLIKSADSRINGFGTELLFIVVQDSIKTGSPVTNFQFAFEILQRLIPKANNAYVYLKSLIKTNFEKEEFIKAYVNAQNNNPDFYAKFENESKNESFLAEFCTKKDIFCFINQTPSQKNLKEYFDKYYVTGKDTGLFVKRLKEYICAVQPDKRINECNNMLKLTEKADIKLLYPVYCVILEIIFSEPYGKIYDLCEKQEWFDKINKIYEIITNTGSSLNQETHELTVIMLCGRILEKYGFKNDSQQIQSFFSKTQADTGKIESYINLINSEKSINTFIDYYFDLVANILIVGATAKIFDYEGVLKKVFGKIIENGNSEKLTEHIIYGIKKSKAVTIAFILFIFRKRIANSSNNLDKKLGEIAEKYFEKISSGDRKRTFADLLALAEKEETVKFERYFEEFNNKHKSGFFSFLKK
jgi:hypothetical protein